MTVEESTIADLDKSFDLSSIDPDELLGQLGLSMLNTDQLLARLKKGASEIKALWKSKSDFKRDDFIAQLLCLERKYAPTAYAVYKSFRLNDKEPRMSVFLVSNRAQAVDCSPDTVIFWDNSDIIFGLFKALEKEGYYGSA